MSRGTKVYFRLKFKTFYNFLKSFEHNFHSVLSLNTLDMRSAVGLIFAGMCAAEGHKFWEMYICQSFCANILQVLELFPQIVDIICWNCFPLQNARIENFVAFNSSTLIWSRSSCHLSPVGVGLSVASQPLCPASINKVRSMLGF